MRRVFYVLFAVIYATLSTGAPALVHFCSHEEVFHLSTTSHEHEEIDCCHNEATTLLEQACPTQPSSETVIVNEDECCLTSYVVLDAAKQENALQQTFIPFVSATIKSFTAYGAHPNSQTPATVPTLRGPPLYLLLTRLVLYA